MKRVLILSGDSLFGLGIRGLLSQEAELTVVGYETDLDRAIERLDELEPDVVLLDQERWPGEPPAQLMGSLGLEKETLVIGLSTRTNTICSYRRAMRPVNRLEDLMEAIMLRS